MSSRPDVPPLLFPVQPMPLPIFLYDRFPALRSRDFRLLWMGQTISVVGTQMQSGTIYWHLYELTRSPLALGLIGLCRVGPIIVFSLLGGACADAFDRRRILIVTTVVLALNALALALLTHSGRISAAAIYLLAALGATTNAFSNPARQSFVPNLVPREHFVNAVSLNSLTNQAASIIGPMLAGVLIARQSIAAVYGVNALSFLPVIYALAAMQSPGARGDGSARGEVSLAALREGLDFVRHTPILVWTVLLDFFATFFASASALLPVFAREVLHVGPQGYGALAAAPAVGSLLAGGVMAMRPPVYRQGVTILWAVFAYGAATVVFGISSLFWLSWLALAVTGGSDTISAILRHTLRQIVTPDHLRGRMTAVNMIFFMGGPQLGELEAGLAANWMGAQGSVILGGIGCLLSVAWVAARAPALRRYTNDDPLS